MLSTEASLRRLQTNHIDIYQLHRPDPATELQESLEAHSNLVDQGKVRYIGTSTFPGIHLVKAHWISERRNLHRVACEQPPYSILARQIERVMPVAAEHGMGLLAWSPLAGGFLTGKYRDGARPPDSRAERYTAMGRATAARYDDQRADVQRKHEVVEQLARVADGAGLTLVELAMGFVMASPAITSALIGPRTMEQFEGSVAAAETILGDDVLDAIDAIVPPGTTIADPYRGFIGPCMTPTARRRSTTT